MKSKKLLSVLTAVALSGGAITTAAVVSPSIVSATETMADQYDPYFDDVTITAENSGRSNLRSNLPLPSGTQYLLTDFSDYGVSNGIYFKMYDYSFTSPHLYVGNWRVSAKGASTNARVTVIYPDRSAEIITANLTLIPPNNENYVASYGNLELKAGETRTVPVQNLLPLNTTISLVNTSTLQDLRTAGWEFEVVSGTSLKVTAPEGAVGGEELNFIVNYPDGTVSSFSTVLGIAVPPLAEEIDLRYPEATVNAGESITIKPLNVEIPDGTHFYHWDYLEIEAIINAGGSVEVQNDGTIFIDVPVHFNQNFSIHLEGWYPDGSYDLVSVPVSVIPADFANNHDVTYTDTTLTAGNTTTITPTTTNLPDNTTITLVDNTALTDARNNGWTITTTPNGKLTVSASENTVEKITISMLVSYADGTSEFVSVNVTALAKPVVEEPKDDDPIDPKPAPKANGSSFGSS